MQMTQHIQIRSSTFGTRYTSRHGISDNTDYHVLTVSDGST